MKLSLIIPTYNEKENIQELIRKIQKEFDENLEKVFECSVDEGLTVIYKYY